MIKETVEDVHAKLKTAEKKSSKSDDRVTRIQKAIEDEKLNQHRLDDMVGRVLAKKHYADKQLEEALGIAKNLETDNAVRHGLSLL